MSVTAYKKNQGRPTRQIALCAVVAVLSWFLIQVSSLFWKKQSGLPWLGMTVLAIGASAFLSVVLLNRPKWADFLISVQQEIDRVTWPSMLEVKRATIVVLFLLSSMSVLIFGFDLVWQWVFELIGFLQISKKG